MGIYVPELVLEVESDSPSRIFFAFFRGSLIVEITTMKSTRDAALSKEPGASPVERQSNHEALRGKDTMQTAQR